jgi:hypothetical protein
VRIRPLLVAVVAGAFLLALRSVDRTDDPAPPPGPSLPFPPDPSLPPIDVPLPPIEPALPW